MGAGDERAIDPSTDLFGGCGLDHRGCSRDSEGDDAFFADLSDEAGVDADLIREQIAQGLLVSGGCCLDELGTAGFEVLAIGGDELAYKQHTGCEQEGESECWQPDACVVFGMPERAKDDDADGEA